MLSAETTETLESHVETCNAAREALEDALDEAVAASGDDRDEALQSVADALTRWQAAQRGFIETVQASEVSDIAMASMLLKQNADVDASNARCGIPGAHVDGTDQPFNVDVTGERGQALTTAAMEYMDA